MSDDSAIIGLIHSQGMHIQRVRLGRLEVFTGFTQLMQRLNGSGKLQDGCIVYQAKTHGSMVVLINLLNGELSSMVVLMVFQVLHFM